MGSCVHLGVERTLAAVALSAVVAAGCSRPPAPPAAMPVAPPAKGEPPAPSREPAAQAPAPEAPAPAAETKKGGGGKRRRHNRQTDAEKGSAVLDPADPVAFLKVRVNLDRAGTFFPAVREVLKTGNKDHARAIGDFVVKHQNEHGGWPQIIKPGEPYFSPYLGSTPGVTPEDGKMDRPIQVLLQVHEITGDARYMEAAKKAGDGLLKAQNREGSWPHEWCADAALMKKQTDYLGVHCMNDQATTNAMRALFLLWQKTKEERFRAGVAKAGEWLFAAELHGPVSGWAQQYGADGEPCFGRAFEPPGLGVLETRDAMYALIECYLKVETGAEAKAKVQAAVEEACAWLDKNRKDGGWAAFYDHRTGKPIGAKDRQVVYGVPGVDVDLGKNYRAGYNPWGGLNTGKVREALKAALEGGPAPQGR